MERTVTDLYRAHASFVERALRRAGVADRDLADATQDVFIVVHRQLDGFEGRAQPRTWLYRIAWNVASEYRRRAFRRRELLEEPSECSTDAASVEELVETQRSISALLDAIDRLDIEKREALICHELDDQPMIAVARRLGIPLKTAFSRLYAARRALQLDLRKQGLACLPWWAWPSRNVLETLVSPVRMLRFRLRPSWLALPSRALFAVALVGLMPAPAWMPLAAATPAASLAARQEPVLVAQAEEIPPQRAAAVTAPQRIAPHRERARPLQNLEPVSPPLPAAELPQFSVVRTGQIDFGLGPFGESPLANPPLVVPHQHPRTILMR